MALVASATAVSHLSRSATTSITVDSPLPERKDLPSTPSSDMVVQHVKLGQNQPFSADLFYVFSYTAHKVRRCGTFENASVPLACLVPQRGLDWLSDILTFVHVCGWLALFSGGCQYRPHTRLGRRPCGRMRFSVTWFDIPHHIWACSCRTILNLSKRRRFRVSRGCVSHCAGGVSTGDGSFWVDSFLVLADVQGPVQATSMSEAAF